MEISRDKHSSGTNVFLFDSKIFALVESFIENVCKPFTEFLNLFLFFLRYHRIGLVVLFLHDIADVCLESTKIGTCFKNRTKDPHPLAEKWVILGFIAFAGAWYVFIHFVR